ncbi:hypothetical protein M0R89_02505 [Halorussus limi]|uniref:Uncharacterized protein n=1 Tax=Halorussus limi TaxID=2938695 RepID=A0A8U0HW83_9EURY|nr:hypothetical protein [Halorussus limi]UPV74946.1 hypothetical protein M0R89_02505 [Halorussus limi]
MIEDNPTRRTMLKTAGLAIGGTCFTGTAFAKESKQEGTKVNANVPEFSVLAEDNQSGLYAVESRNKISLYRVDESKGGQVTKTPLGSAADIESISASDTKTVDVEWSGVQTQNVGMQDVTTQGAGVSVVEQSKEIDRTIGDCKTDNGYNHQYNGVTFTLSATADVLGKATITEAIGALVVYYLGTGIVGGILSSLAAIAATAILSLYTGRNYTVCAKDGYIDWDAGYSPQINGVVANSYNASASSTTDVAFIPDVHMGGEHEISNSLAHNNPWQQ